MALISAIFSSEKSISGVSARIALSLRLETGALTFLPKTLEKVVYETRLPHYDPSSELSQLVADKHRLSCLKMEGCSKLKEAVLSSTILSALWLSNLQSVNKKNIQKADARAVIHGLQRGCPRLQN